MKDTKHEQKTQSAKTSYCRDTGEKNCIVVLSYIHIQTYMKCGSTS